MKVEMVMGFCAQKGSKIVFKTEQTFINIYKR